MRTVTQKERIAAVEAHQTAHRREHALNDQVWAAKLDAIDARVRGIERILLETRLPEIVRSEPTAKRSLGKRDITAVSGSAALTSLVWWLADVVRSVAGG